MDDRVDSGPRDRRFVLGSDVCDAATSPATERFRGNIVPHGIKRKDIPRLNRGGGLTLMRYRP